METQKALQGQKPVITGTVSTCFTQVMATSTQTLSGKFNIPLENTPTNFTAGKIALHLNQWQEITSDFYILNCVKGYKIEFEDQPCQFNLPKPINFNSREKLIVNQEIEKLLSVNVVEKTDSLCTDEFVSNIFLRPKKNGKFRMILNLKSLNECVEYHHFKMETLKSAINLVTKDCFFASVDLTDAYYSCMVDKSDRTFLRFIWEGEKYQYTCLPNGLATAPRIFTKIMKPVFSTLRKQGHANVSYIDDSLLISKSEAECVENIKETVLLLDKLGFTVHPEKSVLYPTKLIQFLGFWINSAEMVVSLTCEKAEAIETLCKQIVEENTITIRKFAQLIGKLVASEPGVTYAPLYYKTLEIEKDCVLKESSGDFDSYITVSNKSLLCIQWWIDNVTNSSKSLEIDDPILVIKSDSSMKGWGCFNENTGECAQGFWNDSEKQCHINYLELKAGFLGIKEFCSTLTNCHVKLYMDNTVAVTYINKMGGKIENLNDLTKNIWIWCMNKNIWLSASHIAGVDNIEADFLSRDKHSDMEWMLNKEVFDKIQGIYGVCDIDLFASKHNKQLPRYSSYMPDKHAHVIDAFSVNWSHMKLYIFCPFSVMTQVLAKIERDKSEAVLIAPIWATQTWFPKLLHLICQVSYILPKRTDLLILPHNPTMRHPLEKMRLGVFRLSGNQLKVQTYQKTLLKLYVHHGKIPQKYNIGTITKSGCNFVVKNKLIHLRQM